MQTNIITQVLLEVTDIKNQNILDHIAKNGQKWLKVENEKVYGIQTHMQTDKNGMQMTAPFPILVHGLGSDNICNLYTLQQI